MRQTVIILAFLLIAAAPARALEGFTSVERYVAMPENQQIAYLVGALESYAALADAGLIRSERFAARLQRLTRCAHNRALGDITHAVAREAAADEARANASMASALPRFLERVCGKGGQ